MSMDHMENIATTVLQDQARNVARVTVSVATRTARQAAGMSLKLLLGALSSATRALKHRTLDQYKSGRISISELQSRSVQHGGVQNVEIGQKQIGEVARQLKQLGVDFSVTHGADSRVHLHFVARDLATVRHGIEQAKLTMGQSLPSVGEQEKPAPKAHAEQQYWTGPGQQPQEQAHVRAERSISEQDRVDTAELDVVAPQRDRGQSDRGQRPAGQGQQAGTMKLNGDQLRDELNKKIDSKLAEPRVSGPKVPAPKMPAKGAR